MSFTYLLLLCCIVVSFSSCQQSILFIGNSFTYYNNLPDMFAKLTEDSFVQKSLTVGGQSLCGHAQDHKVKELLTKKWDYVVLQDHSLGALSKVNNGTLCRNFTINCFEKFYIPILENSGTKNVILYQTWGYRYGLKGQFDNYQNMQKDIITGYEEYQKVWRAKTKLNVHIAPAGQIRQVIHSKIKEPLKKSSLFYRLYVEDNFHPTPIGTYISACSIFLRTMMKSPYPSKFVPTNVTLLEAEYIQKIAGTFLNK
ncbi:hypothetical protein AKO1_014323 [Acrasis kona]|uniref:DUF4886 domain-containing protein n=1 Tax=Acrasis kona TaxID=1008807 RepID=A0AAW2Z0U0_9EUKA